METYLDKVAVRNTSLGVSITRFGRRDMERCGYANEDDFITFYMNLRFPGETYTVINESEIPKDAKGQWDKSKRDCWSLKNGKVEVDQDKVVAKEARKASRQAVLTKLKITEEELKEIIRG